MSKCTHCETTGVVGVICDRCRIAELEKELDEAMMETERIRLRLELKIDELEEEIKKYATHTNTCATMLHPLNMRCDCGYNFLLNKNK